MVGKQGDAYNGGYQQGDASNHKFFHHKFSSHPFNRPLARSQVV